MKNKDTTARILAVVGGLVGMLGVLGAIVISGLDFVLVVKDENIEASRSLVGMSWGLVGILGGVMKWGDIRIPGLVMLLGGVAGLVTMPAYFSVGGVILIAAAALAFSSRRVGSSA